MTEPKPLELTEDRVPLPGIEEGITELVDLYGGQITGERERGRDFILPLRRGFAGGGGVECTISWSPVAEDGTTVTLATNRHVDAPRAQRVLLLLAGAIGSVLFMLWPFFQNQREYGALAWLGGLIAIAVYLLTLRKSSGGIAADFLQRLAARQRALQD
ncbi:MAG: hypothetical protein ABI779_13090 [Acidobacteriota bacterium]